jgi:hypothetical protein
MCDAAEAVRRQAALSALEAHWRVLRRTGGLPRRAEIDPRAIEEALEFAFLAERVAPGVARLRLAGMHLGELMGMEVRGLPLSALFEPGAREALKAATELAWRTGAPVAAPLAAARGLGRPALSGRLLLLPLAPEAGTEPRLLGGLALDGAIGRAPRRLQLAGPARLVEPAVPVAAAAPSTAPAAAPLAARTVMRPAPGPTAVPGLCEPAARYTVARGHLRLVHSRD